MGKLSKKSKDLSNWMSLIPGNVYLRNLAIPGYHYNYRIGWKTLFCELENLIANDTYSKLESGVRLFDIHVVQHYENLVVTHGGVVTKLPLSSYFDFLRGWLYAHPKETIILRINKGHDLGQKNGRRWFWDYQKINRFGIIDAYQGVKEPTLAKARGSIVITHLGKSSIDIPDIRAFHSTVNGTLKGLQIRDCDDVSAYSEPLKNRILSIYEEPKGPVFSIKERKTRRKTLAASMQNMHYSKMGRIEGWIILDAIEKYKGITERIVMNNFKFETWQQMK